MKFIYITFLFFIITNITSCKSDSKVTTYKVIENSMLRFDGYYIMHRLWNGRIDSTATTFFFCKNGSVASISTPIDMNPVFCFADVNESKRKQYEHMFNWGNFEIKNDTAYVTIIWNMYGRLGGKEYNNYRFAISENGLILNRDNKVTENLNIQSKELKRKVVAKFYLSDYLLSCPNP